MCGLRPLTAVLVQLNDLRNCRNTQFYTASYLSFLFVSTEDQRLSLTGFNGLL